MPWLAAAVLAAGVGCQCSTHWVPPAGVLGFNNVARAMKLWDPDGAGPLPAVLLVAGAFTVWGSPDDAHIAGFDPATGAWSPFGAVGTNGAVYALASLPNGDLVAGGAFTRAGGVTANRIARWNGSTWQPLGIGTNGTVLALTVLPNGDVIAGGEFTTAGGAAANYVARWDGVSWSPLGVGMDASVRALTTMANGDVVAGGTFSSAGGTLARRIARWDGSQWSWMGGGMSPNSNGFFALLTLANGDVVAGGEFSSAESASANNVARWSNGTWFPYGSGVPVPVRALTVLANGNLVADLRRWNGSSWSILGSPTISFWWPTVYAAVALPNGNFVVGGDVISVGGPRLHLSQWNGATWTQMSTDFDGPLNSMVTMPNGDVVVSGQFTMAPGMNASSVARWNGSNWSAMPGPSGNVRVLGRLPNGDLIASAQLGGSSQRELARWNGSSWFPLGAGMTFNFLGDAYAFVVMPNGDWVVAGSFTSIGGVLANSIARWNGTTWSALGTGTNFPVQAIGVLPNSDLVAAGLFTTAGGLAANRIARWDGTSWSPFGSGMTLGISTTGVSALLVLPSGEIIAGGDFTMAGGVACANIAAWDGRTWRPLGAGANRRVSALLKLPNGDLVASGAFHRAGGVAANGLARWNGSTWAPLTQGPYQSGDLLGVFPDGDLLVAGQKTASGAFVAMHARVTTTCPALAVPSGSGCNGAGGPDALAAATLPWLGTTFRANATGLPGNAIAIGVVGLHAISTPLSSLSPLGLAGCTLFATPDLLFAGLPNGGTLATQLAIPNTPALATQTLRMQVVTLELDAVGAITAVTSTNALALTIGAF